MKRPKDSKQLYDMLKKGEEGEVVDTHAFKAAKYLEALRMSFTFKLSAVNKGWAVFKKV